MGKNVSRSRDHLEEAIETRKAVADIEELDSAENAAEARTSTTKALEVYAPVIDGGYVIGALEIYADASRIEASIAGKKHVIWLATFAVFALLWGLLVLLVRTASSTLRRQTDQLRKRSKDLMAAYAKLEESSLEAIESLNATVEAKDPYTAGHSRRVQRIAVAIGEELELPKDRLDPLRLGALFHDIGKLRVPDAILTKPARLTTEEFEADQAALRGRRPHRRQVRAAPRNRADDPAPPRALGRSWLSRRPRHRRDPARGLRRRARGCLGRDDDRFARTSAHSSSSRPSRRCATGAERSLRPTSSTPSSRPTDAAPQSSSRPRPARPDGGLHLVVADIA